MYSLGSRIRTQSRQLEVFSRPRCSNLVVATLLVTGTLGCTSMGSIEPLDVTLANLKVTEVTVFETTLVAKLRITNPNPEAFSIEGASFKLYLENKKVGTGTSKESFTVDRLDSHVVDVIFHMNNASAFLRLKDIFQNNDKEISYGVRGGLYTQGAFGTKKLKVEKSGTIDLEDVSVPEADEPDINDVFPAPGGRQL
jgi:LEA14-like dessication related protein